MAIKLMSNPLQMKRGTKLILEASDYVPAEGEPIVELDTGKLKIGNGTAKYSALPYVGA